MAKSHTDTSLKAGSSNELSTPFDSYFRVSMRRPEIGIPFCKTHLPTQLVNKINFSTFNVLNRSFLSPQMRHSACDVLIEFELLTQPEQASQSNNRKPEKLNIAIIIEHQSTPDKFMAFRMFQYMFNYLNEKFEQRKPKSQLLNPIYPLLFYNGTRSPYPYSLDFYDTFNDPHGIMKQVLNQAIKVIDVNQLNEDKLKTQQLLGIMTRAMKVRNVTVQVVEYLTNLLIDLHLELSNANDDHLNDINNYIKTVITYLASISDSNDLHQAIDKNERIPQTVRGEYMTAAEYFRQEGLEQGIERGIERGIETGIEKGILKTAVNALKKGFAIETVVDLTELDKTAVEQLKRELDNADK